MNNFDFRKSSTKESESMPIEHNPLDKVDLDLDELRDLRGMAKTLCDTVVEDLASFIHQRDGQTFVRLPTSEHRKNDVGVTVSCSCLMGLSITGKLDSFQARLDKRKWSPNKCFEMILETNRWTSSGLTKMNAFTSALVLRTFGMLVEKGRLEAKDSKLLVHIGEKQERKKFPDGDYKPVPSAGGRTRWSLEAVFKNLAKPGLENLRVEAYPVSAAVVYWFLDAVDRSNLSPVLQYDFWKDVASWAAREFWRQISLITARNDAFMDPIAMAMAACICKKLKTLAESLENVNESIYALGPLPSEPELESGLKLLFKCQADSGIWPKYFPLFHYPDAGGNFCFTFEMLEALLNEFGKGEVRILEIPGAFDAVGRAILWCKQNRFEYKRSGELYRGWNSGGQPMTLTTGMPESWATAVVHMFLWEAEDALSRKIEQKLFALYRAKRHKQVKEALDDFVDIEILIRGRSRSLVSLVNEHIVKPALKDSPDLHRNGLSGKVSALLFGPPGTSKTELCGCVAQCLGWPLVELDPSHFLKDGVEGISVHADRIFNNLMDLNGAVILFDEMDALVQTRDTEDWHLDTTSQLLTTSMLPKLAKLHERRRVIFFMATNFQNRFDPAIKRTGRFDLLLCMGPPTLGGKLEHLELFLKDLSEASTLRELLKAYIRRDVEVAQMLDLFTFGEMKALFRSIGAKGSVLKVLRDLRLPGFKARLIEEEDYKTLRLNDLDHLPAHLRKMSVRQLVRDRRLDVDSLKEELRFPVIRYIVDKRQSKIQV
ncbi:MAG TPA: ATP-binding protein [Verrucomicrobiae bacterium]|nr:ATP-binding protein [Verrucomicrobiae bacterium]